ncbi:MAG: hypothetical protein IJV22_09705 [Bacteroidales bacterium]|nr:hypothetical protein [Bacteroidales bacterium]
MPYSMRFSKQDDLQPATSHPTPMPYSIEPNVVEQWSLHPPHRTEKNQGKTTCNPHCQYTSAHLQHHRRRSAPPAPANCTLFITPQRATYCPSPALTQQTLHFLNFCRLSFQQPQAYPIGQTTKKLRPPL